MKCKNDNLNIVCVIAFFMIVQTIHGLRSNFSAGNNMTAYTPEKIDKEINIVNHQIDNFVKKINKTSHFLKRISITEDIPTQNETKNETKVNETLVKNNQTKMSKTTGQILYSFFSPSYSIMEEMQINHDERNKIFVYKIICVISIIANLFMFITWQLCNKTSKFPIKILSYQFNTNNGIILMIIVTQFLKSSQDFLNFSFISTISLNYINIVFNLLYISSISFSLIYPITNYFIHIYSIAIYLTLFIVCWFFIIFTFVNRIKIKSCFIGACASEFNSQLILTFIPYFIESIISIFFISFGVIAMLIRKEKNFCYIKAFIFEFLYIALNFSNSFVQFIKTKNNSDVRYDEYGSIHDYVTVLRSVLLISFCFTLNDIKEWYILFKQEESVSKIQISKENKEIDIIVQEILSYNIIKQK